MRELEERICQILKKHFKCECHLRARHYCKAVVDLVDLTLEKCEGEHEG